MKVIFEKECEDRTGDHTYEVRVLHEFGQGDGYLNPDKIAELWKMAKKYEVLFSDYTAGKVEPFLNVILNPRSVWFEIFRATGAEPGPIGVAYISDVIPRFDAKGHFAFWDRVAKGREPIVWGIMEHLFNEYELRRISAETPPYQAGTIRFIKNLGFVQEGERREAVIHRGKWMPLIEFGILRDEFEEVYSNHFIRELEVSHG